MNLVGILSIGFWKQSSTYIGSPKGHFVEHLIFCEVLLLLEGMSGRVE